MSHFCQYTNSDLLAGKLSIILTLKDRSDFTIRWMTYMNDIHCPFKILIGDGGVDPLIQVHLEHYDNYPNLNYQYLRFTPDNSFRDYFMKLEKITELVTSEYLLFADNDDFYNIEYFNEYIHFLDERRDFVGIRGGTQVFWVSDRNNLALNSPVGNSYSAIDLAGTSIENDLDIERIEKFLLEIEYLDHFMNWYCISRTKNVRDTIIALNAIESLDPFIYEFMFLTILLKQGKFKVDSKYSYFRQQGTSQAMVALKKEQPLAFRRIFLNNGFTWICDLCEINKFYNDENEKARILTAVSKMFEYQIIAFNRPLSYVGKVKIFLIGFPFINKLVYDIYKILRGIVGKKKFIRIPLIEDYILKRK